MTVELDRNEQKDLDEFQNDNKIQFLRSGEFYKTNCESKQKRMFLIADETCD
jgi:hypothetical protein